MSGRHTGVQFKDDREVLGTEFSGHRLCQLRNERCQIDRARIKIKPCIVYP